MTAPLPQTAEQDAYAMVDLITPFAHDMLRRYRAFVPVGAGVDHAGQVVPFAARPGDAQDTADAFAVMLDQLRGDRDNWRAVCLAVDTTNPEYGDTIEFHLDFAGGTTGLVLVLPYRPGGLWRGPVFADPITMPGPAFVYGDPLDPDGAEDR
ncbi:hypothetical protein [Propionicimonas sp.]|uniref:hypothetical protein n=1 Tax=Propionicimonas sp. TaxID=1955623 RepID=UPI0039E246E8